MWSWEAMGKTSSHESVWIGSGTPLRESQHKDVFKSWLLLVTAAQS